MKNKIDYRNRILKFRNKMIKNDENMLHYFD